MSWWSCSFAVTNSPVSGSTGITPPYFDKRVWSRRGDDVIHDHSSYRRRLGGVLRPLTARLLVAGYPGRRPSLARGLSRCVALSPSRFTVSLGSAGLGRCFADRCTSPHGGVPLQRRWLPG